MKFLVCCSCLHDGEPDNQEDSLHLYVFFSIQMMPCKYYVYASLLMLHCMLWDGKHKTKKKKLSGSGKNDPRKAENKYPTRMPSRLFSIWHGLFNVSFNKKLNLNIKRFCGNCRITFANLLSSAKKLKTIRLELWSNSCWRKTRFTGNTWKTFLRDLSFKKRRRATHNSSEFPSLSPILGWNLQQKHFFSATETSLPSLHFTIFRQVVKTVRFSFTVILFLFFRFYGDAYMFSWFNFLSWLHIKEERNTISTRGCFIILIKR